MPVERLSGEEVGASTSAGPSRDSTENTPSKMPAHGQGQALPRNSTEHPSLPNEHMASIVPLPGSSKKPGVSCRDQKQSEKEVAEQRRLVRKAREMEDVEVWIADSPRSSVTDLLNGGA